MRGCELFEKNMILTKLATWLFLYVAQSALPVGWTEEQPEDGEKIFVNLMTKEKVNGPATDNNFKFSNWLFWLTLLNP